MTRRAAGAVPRMIVPPSAVRSHRTDPHTCVPCPSGLDALSRLERVKAQNPALKRRMQHRRARPGRSLCRRRRRSALGPASSPRLRLIGMHDPADNIICKAADNTSRYGAPRLSRRSRLAVAARWSTGSAFAVSSGTYSRSRRPNRQGAGAMPPSAAVRLDQNEIGRSGENSLSRCPWFVVPSDQGRRLCRRQPARSAQRLRAQFPRLARVGDLDFRIIAVASGTSSFHST
jgi:hypothetical protein